MRRTIHNVALKTNQTKEITTDFRRTNYQQYHLLTIWSCEEFTALNYLGVIDKLTSTDNTTAIMINHAFTPYAGWSTTCIIVIYSLAGSETTQQKKIKVNMFLRTAEKIISAFPPCLQDIYTECCSHWAISIIKDSIHRSHGLFRLTESGQRHRSIKSRTIWLLNSFFPNSNQTAKPEHVKYT